MATPCSVKTSGKYLGSRCFCEPVAICDRFNNRTSSGVRRNMKSSGNLSLFRFTCSLNLLVLTEYSNARSLSIITFFPLMRRILFTIRSTGTLTLFISIYVKNYSAVSARIYRSQASELYQNLRSHFATSCYTTKYYC